MSRVEEIEAAIDGLSPDDYTRIVEWFRMREQRRWDEQLDADSRLAPLHQILISPVEPAWKSARL
jgi:hypothetical protein